MYRCCYCMLALMVLATSVSTAQQWTRAYGGSGSEQGKFIEPTADGGFIVGGMQSATPQGATRYWAARFDSAGNKLWDSNYGRAGLSHTLFAFNPTKDGGFMIGGFTGIQFSGTESALMYRANSSGAVQWSVDIDYSSSDHWHLLLERPGGGYYMGGHTDSKDDPAGDMWLMKLDTGRQTIWEKTYNLTSTEHAHGGIGTNDGGVLMLGHTNQGNREKFWGVKVDSNGTIEWNKVFGSDPNYHDSPYKVFETAQGNFVFIGGSSHPTQDEGTMWLLMVDPEGNVLLDKHYGASGGSSFSWSGRQTSDGGFILAGHTNYRTQGLLDMMIVKTDSAGNVEWDEKFGGTGYDYGFDVIEVNDGFIAAGYTGSPSIMTGGGGDLYLVKIAKSAHASPALALVSPLDKATGITANPQVRWSAAANAVGYQIQLDDDSLFGSPQVNASTVSSTSRNVTGLTPGTYYWRVRPMYDAGAGVWSAPWRFTVGTVSGVETGAITSRAIGLSVAPNPSYDRATIRLENAPAGRMRLTIVDVQGRTVASIAQGRLDGGEQQFEAQVGELATGVYSLRLELLDAGEVHVQPLTVVR